MGIIDQLEQEETRQQKEMRERIERQLPKWAQLYFFTLMRDVAELKAERQAVDAEQTDIWWDFGLDRTKHHLPSRADIHFDIAGKIIYARIRYTETSTFLRISGNRTLTIIPEASNAIVIR
jgi:hypothetical protein